MRLLAVTTVPAEIFAVMQMSSQATPRSLGAGIAVGFLPGRDAPLQQAHQGDEPIADRHQDEDWHKHLRGAEVAGIADDEAAKSGLRGEELANHEADDTPAD